MRKTSIALLLGLLAADYLPVSAQLSEGGFPIAETVSPLKSAAAIPTISMPPFSIADEMDATRPKCGNKFAHKFATSINIKAEADMETVGNVRVYKLAIHSEGAHSLNLIFQNFLVPEGARLFVYSPGKEQLLGAFTHKNNTPNRFAIAPVSGDKIVVEYEEPVNTLNKANLTIESVNHDYRNLKSQLNFAASQPCEVDAASAEVHLGKQSACLLLINGDVFCSGNMVNNTAQDGNPYIVTAGHCFWKENRSGQEVLDTALAQTTIAFFNYESPSSEWPIEGSQQMTLSGASTIAYRMNHDMLLIRMNQVPPIDFRPFYAGWNRETSIQGPVHVFHHPMGDVKKFSVDAATPSTRSFGYGFKNNVHWRIYRWDSGMTEGGSSGSGLFDKNELLVGNLTGGDTASSCSRPGDDFFWKYCDVWDDQSEQRHNLGFWLDPLGSNASSLKGISPYSDPCRRISNRLADELPAVPDSYGPDFAVGNNLKGMTEFAEKFTVHSPVTLYGVYFYPMVGKYSDRYPVMLRIYKGSSQPDFLVYEQRLKVSTSLYQKFNGQFFDQTTLNMGGCENYMRLATPLKLEGDFFVSFAVPYCRDTKLFALNYSEPREKDADNTAFFLDSSSTWLPFTQHPSINAPTSLMADVVLKNGWDEEDALSPAVPEAPYNPAEDISYPSGYDFYPSVTNGMVYFGIPKHDVLKEIQVIDMSGHTIFTKEQIEATANYSLDLTPFIQQQNTYIIKARFKNNTNTFRFFFKK